MQIPKNQSVGKNQNLRPKIFRHRCMGFIRISKDKLQKFFLRCIRVWESHPMNPRKIVVLLSFFNQKDSEFNYIRLQDFVWLVAFFLSAPFT